MKDTIVPAIPMTTTEADRTHLAAIAWHLGEIDRNRLGDMLENFELAELAISVVESYASADADAELIEHARAKGLKIPI